jgi:voltage-gated potassium channel
MEVADDIRSGWAATRREDVVTRTVEGRGELKNTGYEIFIGILSVLSILNLVLLYAIQDPALDTVLWVMNAILSAIFLADFTYRLFTAPSKAHYFFRTYGWADLLASVPLQQAKILRVFRLARVFRLLREYGLGNIARNLLRDRAGSALLTLLLMGILVLEFGSLEMLHVEQRATGANITTASDALWYTIVTISTVGYGDRYPVTNEGRVIGSLIIVVGVAIFGTFTGYLANLFLTPRKAAARPPETAATPVDVGQLQALMVRQQAAIDEMKVLLDGR